MQSHLQPLAPQIPEWANAAWVRTLAPGKVGPEAFHFPGVFGKKSLDQLRSEADRIAFWLRYHDPALHERLLPREVPARIAFEALERARVLAVGGRRFPGVVRNRVSAMISGSGMDFGPEALEGLAFFRLLEMAAGMIPSAAEHCSPFPVWSGIWESLKLHLEDQEAYGREVAAFLAKNPDAIDPAWADRPQKQAAAAPETPFFLDPAEDEDFEDVDIRRTDFLTQGELPTTSETEAETTGYHPFTTAFDRVVPASRLLDPFQRAALRLELDRGLQPYRQLTARLSRRMVRQLLAWQRRAWMFDREEGLLDPGRLTGLVVNPCRREIFRTETESPFPATVVSLLMDNSGSMKGGPILTAALTAEILSGALERCGIKTEILGYTTRHWEGGRSGLNWRKTGALSCPGRLNDLLHIVYKSADTPWRHARRDFGVMLHPDLLKENIDGEALAWAWQRLLARHEPRRILMVVCDGRPRDEFTQSANPPDYLERHLSAVIDRIEASPVQLAAIGIGHDVSRYYRQAVFLRSMDELGKAMIRQLLHLSEP